MVIRGVAPLPYKMNSFSSFINIGYSHVLYIIHHSFNNVGKYESQTWLKKKSNRDSITIFYVRWAFHNTKALNLTQEKLVVKDFNIEKAANGTNKAFTMSFPHIFVTNYVEIRFYYAGKGSWQIPVRGNYGPLISAISVQSGE